MTVGKTPSNKASVDNSFDHIINIIKDNEIGMCSTPFGITASITSLIQSRFLSSESAQRLSASQLRSHDLAHVLKHRLECSTPFGITASITRMCG